MKRLNYKKYLFFSFLVLFVVSLPLAFVEGLRNRLVTLLFPIWQKADISLCSQSKENLAKINKLEIENYLLRVEIGKLSAELEKKFTIASLEKECASEKKSKEKTEDLLKAALSSVCANVIYRDPGLWAHALWINVGEETNKQIGQDIIKKNSPVLYGRSVVGAIDYVGKNQSKVRLISDPALKPAVRAARGRPQNIFIQENIQTLLRQLRMRPDVSDNLVNELKQYRDSLATDCEGWYLAKGILQGSKTPFCRNLSLLCGIGFNYDFDDKEGPARDLVTGRSKGAGEARPIIKRGDLLLTSGMDGIFPPGLRVAEVSSVLPLKEGACTYEIEATPLVGNLSDLFTVFVIAPLGFDPKEKT